MHFNKPAAALNFLFLNTGHFLVHFCMLIFATAALQLENQWGVSYAQLIPIAVPGLVIYGIFSLPAGWLADRWSRRGMLIIFFIGIGLSAIIAATSNSTFGLGIALSLIGLFAAIYHPVGLAMVVEGREKTGVPLAVNGVFGNMGVALAALLTGILLDFSGWRSAFYIPGIASIVIGLCYWRFTRSDHEKRPLHPGFKPRKESGTTFSTAFLG